MELGALARILDGVIMPPKNSAVSSPSPDQIEVTGITHNASWVETGDAFVAIRGERTDGHRFIDDALARGVSAIIGEGLPATIGCHVPYLLVPDARIAL